MPDPATRRQWVVRVSAAVHLIALAILVTQPELWRWSVVMVLINHAVLGGLGLWPHSQWLGPSWTRLPQAAVARGEIALTIDDGPDPAVTPQVLDLLDRHAVSATFFCIGKHATLYPELCSEIARRGHAVENHSQQHRHYFPLLGRAGFRRELNLAQETLTGITGERPLFFRAPAGMRNPLLDPVLRQLGLTLASWSARGFDTRIGDGERVTQSLLRDLKPGAILLLHDGNAARTREGVPVILEVLPKVLAAAVTAKLRFVTLRQALG